MSISRWMDKKAVVHIQNGVLAIKKNTFESVLMRWMKLEPIIEWSKPERKTPIQYTNTYIWNLGRWQWPPRIISLDHPCAPAPSILYPVSNIGWQFVSYMIVYMFQCHSPKSSRPLPLPQSPKVCSLHLCLFCCLSYRVIIIIFLNSIYMC